MADPALVIPGEPPGTGDQRGWHRPRIDAGAWFRKVRGRAPNPAEVAVLRRLAAAGRKARAESHDERALEGAILRLGFYAEKGREARGPEVEAINAAADRVVAGKESAYEAAHPSLFKRIGSAATGLGHIVGQGVELVGKIPGVELVGHAAAPWLEHIGEGLANVPGIGTAIGAGISATVALGKGEALSDIGLAAARGSMPGGPAGRMAFDAGVALAKGGKITDVMLSAARNAIPDGPAREGFDAANRIAHGEAVGSVALSVGGRQIARLAPVDAAAALSRARALIPEGPLKAKALEGFDAAAQLAKGFRPASPAMLATARAALPAAQRAPFDAAIALVKRTPPAALAEHAKTAGPLFARAVLAGHAANTAPPAVHAMIVRSLRARTRPRPLSPAAAGWLAGTIRRAGARREAAGLNPGGATYTVEPGDSAWRIAQNLTGDGNHHFLELLAANKQIPQTGTGTKRNFTYLRTGAILNIPAIWHVGAVTQAPPVVLPAATILPPQPAPAPLPSALTPLPSAGPAGTERDDPAAIAQAKSILFAWSKTDGLAAAGLADYGSNPADKSPIWSSRDTFELMAFCKWANAQGASLTIAGDLTQGKLDALVAWAHKKAAGVQPGGAMIPSSPAGSAAVPPPGPSASVIAPPAAPPEAAPVPALAPTTIALPETEIVATPAAAKPAPAAESDSSMLWLLGLGLVGAVVVIGRKKRRARRAA